MKINIFRKRGSLNFNTIKFLDLNESNYDGHVGQYNNIVIVRALCLIMICGTKTKSTKSLVMKLL
jgi:hypothetical protein